MSHTPRYPNHHSRRHLALAIAAALATLGSTGVVAQNVQEITVTAQKRAQPLQEVPIAVTALTAQDIQNRELEDVSDLSGLAPNLMVSKTPGNSTASQIAIRGGVTTNPALFWDTAVGIYVDGVYIGKTQGSIFKLLDLERIEALRGPQGTLYGRNTLAGAINFVTRKPLGEFAAEATVGLGTDSERILKASMDLPSSGALKVGLGLRQEKRDGWVKTAPGSSVKDLNGADETSFRLAATLAATKDFSLDYRFDYSKVDQTPTHSQLVRSDLPFLTDFVFTTRQKTAAVDGELFEISKVQGHTLTADLAASATDRIKVILSSRSMTWEDALDLDGSPLLVAHTQRLSDYDQSSAELQWTGSRGGVNYVAGVYRFEDEGFTNNPQKYFFGTFNFDSRYGFTTESNAIYGQADVQIQPNLTLTAGLRSTEEKKSITRTLGFNTAIGDPFIPLVPAGTSAEETFSATTPMVSLGYKLNANQQLYARYAEGFKSGGFNGEYGVVNPTPEGIASNVKEVQTAFKPETQQSIEVGLKSKIMNGKGLLNLTGFSNKIDDMQLAIFTAEGAAASVIRNAGKAKVDGLEVDGVVQLSSSSKLQFSYGYLNGRYDEFIDKGQNVANNRAFIHAPKHNANLALDSRLAQTGFGQLFGQLEVGFKSSYYLYPFQLAESGAGFDPMAQVAKNTRVGSHAIINARLSLREISLGKGLDGVVSLSVKNLTDKEHQTNRIDFGPGFGNLTQGYYTPPRQVTLQTTLKW